MLGDMVLVALAAVTLLMAWPAWKALYPGLSLRADYGIRGGWFGSGVKVKDTGSGSGRSWSY
jgi:hypothetical protein